MPDVEVTRVVVGGRQRLQEGQFFCEPFRRRLYERAKLTQIGHPGQPLLQLLIEMSKAVEAEIAHEEVLLHLLHHPLHLAFGADPPRAASPGSEAVVVRKPLEAGVEQLVPVVVPEDRGFLVVGQHGFHAAGRVAEGAHQRLVSVLRVLAVGGPDVEAVRVAWGHGEVDAAVLPTNLRPDDASVVLKLVARLGFEAHRFAGRAHFTFGLDVIAQHGTASDIPLRFDSLEDDFGVSGEPEARDTAGSAGRFLRSSRFARQYRHPAGAFALSCKSPLSSA